MSSYPTALHEDKLIQRSELDAMDDGVKAERTDRQLVDLVLDGDHYAFEQIFDRHKRLVAGVASRYFRRGEEIEEIIQIAFAKVFTELDSFRGVHDRSLASWMVRITMNACFDTLRSQRRKPERLNCDLSETEAEALLALTADASLAPENELLDRDLAEKLLSAIPEDDRLLLQMLYAEEMTTADIAEVFGWTKANVKVRAWRARGAARRVLRRFL
jgi:RNA polymerase sigma-70 factor (ECF subfamily)